MKDVLALANLELAPAGSMAETVIKSSNMDTADRSVDGYYNDDFDWDTFNPDSYRAHNYLSVRADDRQIMDIVSDFLVRNADRIRPGAHAFEVGPGANLYPSLAMLPFCDSIDLRERSAANVAWLLDQVAGFDTYWDKFWDVYRESPIYRDVDDPRAALAKKAHVLQDSVFKLPTAEYDLGAMFFVAESLTRDRSEFDVAVRHFLAALRPGAPFIAAFMVNSSGYDVNGQTFPAVAIDHDGVRQCLQRIAAEVDVVKIDDDGDPLRDGCGMVVATGFVVS